MNSGIGLLAGGHETKLGVSHRSQRQVWESTVFHQRCPTAQGPVIQISYVRIGALVVIHNLKADLGKDASFTVYVPNLTITTDLAK